MKLKYEKEIAAFDPCPKSASALTEEFIGYRGAVFPCENPGNFLPIAVMDASRIAGKENGYCCSAYALSMYETKEQLEKQIKDREEFNPNIRKTIGDSWAAIKLNSTSGLKTKAKRGHFNLHEAYDFSGHAQIIQSGPIP